MSICEASTGIVVKTRWPRLNRRVRDRNTGLTSRLDTLMGALWPDCCFDYTCLQNNLPKKTLGGREALMLYSGCKKNAKKLKNTSHLCSPALLCWEKQHHFLTGKRRRSSPTLRHVLPKCPPTRKVPDISPGNGMECSKTCGGRVLRLARISNTVQEKKDKGHMCIYLEFWV